MPKDNSKKSVVIVDPDLWMKRTLHYQEKHGAWAIFATIYWSIYLLLLSLLLVYYTSIGFSVSSFLGTILFILAIMIIIFGFVESLHYKLMKKIG